MRKNYLFSTTRQWNPGDEFILLGCISIIQHMENEEINAIIFNRNPDIRTSSVFNNKWKTKKGTQRFEESKVKGKSLFRAFFRIGFWDNSYKDDTNPEILHGVVLAGSPEWYGNRVEPLFKIIVEHCIPTYILGIGLGENLSLDKLSKNARTVIENAEIITVRDDRTFELLKQYGAKKVTCPAFLAAPNNRCVTEVKKIALIFGTFRTVTNNKINEDVYVFLKKLYGQIVKKYDVGFVCHYIDELEEIKRDFPDAEVFYSYDSKDYIDIYSKFDLVIGQRVHGIGICASLGIPGIMIAHDMRSDTARGFKAQIIDHEKCSIDQAMDIIGETILKVKEISTDLQQYKRSVSKEYMRLLKEEKT